MIRYEGVPVPLQDPKLKAAPIPTSEARAPKIAAARETGTLLPQNKVPQNKVPKKRGRPTSGEPWVKAGVSRRTWFRQHKATAKA